VLGCTPACTHACMIMHRIAVTVCAYAWCTWCGSKVHLNSTICLQGLPNGGSPFEPEFITGEVELLKNAVLCETFAQGARRQCIEAVVAQVHGVHAWMTTENIEDCSPSFIPETVLPHGQAAHGAVAS
jgi:hypothetical protein